MAGTILHKSVLAVLFCLSLTWAAEGTKGEKPVYAQMRIERVALFKNGVGFFVATGALPQNATTIQIGQLPVPVYGTFWVGYPQTIKVQRLVTAFEEIEVQRPAQNIGQLLQANAGVHAVVRTAVGEKEKQVEGVVRERVSVDEIPEVSSPYVMDVRRHNNPYGRGIYNPPNANMVLLDTADGVVALNASSIQHVDFGRREVTDSITVSAKRPSLRLELEEPAGEGALSVTYLARGITWCPSYRIDLADPDNAVLTARALVINEVADLDRVALDLVTGFPNIRFGELLSPVAMSQSLADLLNALATGRTDSGRSGLGHAMTQQRAMVPSSPLLDPFEAVPLPAYSTAVEGTVSEDLFLYPVEGFSLKRGETAYVPLFSATMPYRHIYTWKIEDPFDTQDQYGRPQDKTDITTAEEVWHSCRLRNALDMPLTTAPTEFVNRGQFVGQDLCHYTAPGTETTIRINRAMNILAEQAEYEVDRTRDAASFYGWRYDLVKVRGELRLQSRLVQAVPVEITKELSGEVLEHTPPAEDVTTAKALKKVNPKHVLTWEINLEGGQDLRLSYVYQAYIRS